MVSQNDNFIARNIVELRLSNKNLNFVDYKGEMADDLIHKAGFVNFKMFANRLDLTDTDAQKIFFISWENFGLQLEGVKDDKSLNVETRKMVDLIKNFGKYKIRNISRLGTKTTKLYHPRNKTLANLRQAYTNIFFHNQRIFEGSGISITDNGIFSMELAYKIYKAHLNIGVMTKEEAITKEFQHKSYSDFRGDHGIFVDIDLYNDSYNYVDITSLLSDIEKQLDALVFVQNSVLSTIIGEADNG